MNSGQPLALIPLNDCVLIKLENQYDNFGTKDGKYETRTNGIVIADSVYKGGADRADSLIGKRVFFDEYKEGARIKRDGEQYCFIKKEDIRGFEDVEIK